MVSAGLPQQQLRRELFFQHLESQGRRGNSIEKREVSQCTSGMLCIVGRRGSAHAKSQHYSMYMYIACHKHRPVDMTRRACSHWPNEGTD